MQKAENYLGYFERISRLAPNAFEDENVAAEEVRSKFKATFDRTRIEASALYTMVHDPNYGQLSFAEITVKILEIANFYGSQVKNDSMNKIPDDLKMDESDAVQNTNDEPKTESEQDKTNLLGSSTKGPRAKPKKAGKGDKPKDKSGVKCSEGHFNMNYWKNPYCGKCGQKLPVSDQASNIKDNEKAENGTVGVQLQQGSKVSPDETCMLDQILNLNSDIPKPHLLNVKFEKYRRTLKSLYDGGSGRTYMLESFYRHLVDKKCLPRETLEADYRGAIQADGTKLETSKIVTNVEMDVQDSTGKWLKITLPEVVIASKLNYSLLIGRSIYSSGLVDQILTKEDGTVILNPEPADFIHDRITLIDEKTMSPDQVQDLTDEMIDRDSLMVGEKSEKSIRISLKNGDVAVVSSNRSVKFRKSIEKLLNENLDIVDKDHVCQNKLYTADLKFKYKPPPVAAFNPPSPKIVEILEQKIDQLIKDKAGKKSTKVANSNLFLTPKNNGKPGADGHRLVNDLVSYNKSCQDYEYRCKSPKEILGRLGNSRIYSSSDIRDAYHTVKIKASEPGDPPIAHCPGLPYNFEYEVLAQGLKTAGGHYLASAEMMFPRHEFGSFLFNYMDDNLIASENEEDHLKHWALVVKAHRKSGVKLNLAKTRFGFDEIDFLNFKISHSKVKIGDGHKVAIANISTDKPVDSVNGFLTYFSDFVGAQGRYEDLHKLRKHPELGWTAEKKEALESIKECLVSAGALTIPDFKRAIHILCDASDSGYGFAVCVHKDSDNMKPLHKLRPGERKLLPSIFFARDCSSIPSWRNKTTYQREGIGASHALQKAEYFISGTHPVFLYIDNKAVEMAVTSRSPKVRAMFHGLPENVKTVHIESGKNLADILSRFSEQKVDTLSTIGVQLLDEEIAVQNFETGLEKSTIGVQLNDKNSTIGVQLRGQKSTIGVQLGGQNVDRVSEMSMRKPRQNNVDKKQEILKRNLTMHKRGGHCASDRLYRMNAAIYPEDCRPTRNEIDLILKECYCQYRKLEGTTKKTPTPVPAGTHDLLYLDFKKAGKLLILSILEPLSRSYWALCCANEKTGTLISKMADFLTVYGHVRCIRADNGASFTSIEFREFCARLNIRLTFTAIYNPSANRSERPHSQINRTMILAEEMGFKLNREDIIRFSWTNNILPKKKTQKSPVEILYGGTPQGIFEDSVDEEVSVSSENPVARQVSDHLTRMAFEGMVEQETKTPREVLQLGQRIRWTIQAKLERISRDGTVILANETSCFVKFDKMNKARWVSTKALTKL